MKKSIFGTVGLSALLLVGSTPAVLLAHDGQNHTGRQGEYETSGRWEDTERYDPQYDDEYGEGEDDYYTRRPSTRRYPEPEGERPVPREQRVRPR